MASSCYTMKNAKNVESKMHCRGVELEDGRSIGEIMEEHGIDVAGPVVIRVVDPAMFARARKLAALAPSQGYSFMKSSVPSEGI